MNSAVVADKKGTEVFEKWNENMERNTTKNGLNHDLLKTT